MPLTVSFIENHLELFLTLHNGAPQLERVKTRSKIGP